MMIDTMLFDFDGTLVEVRIDFAKMRREITSLGLEYGVRPSAELYILESVEDMFKNLLKKDGTLADNFRRRAEEIIVSIEMESAETSRIFPYTCKTLSELKGRGIKVGIVTRNCLPAVLKVLQETDLVYDLLLTRDDVKRVKPDPQHLLDALTLLGSRPEKSLMAGDHPADILAGKRAGMKTAAVLTTRPREEFKEVAPDLILTDISDILRYL